MALDNLELSAMGFFAGEERTFDGTSVNGRDERSLDQLAAGGVPPETLERLRKLNAGDGLFTSGLSINEFALLSSGVAQPIAQVMGGSVVRVGPQLLPAVPRRQIRKLDGQKTFKEPSRRQRRRNRWEEPVVCELALLAEAWRLARWRALRRLRDEAVAVSSNLVVGVQLQRAALDLPEGTIDLVVTGTAAMDPSLHRDGPPIFTDLSAQDLVKVRSCGFQPTGLVTASSVGFASAAQRTRWSRIRAPTENREHDELSRAYQMTYDHVRERLRQSVAATAGEGVVGVTVSHTKRTGSFEHRPSLPQHQSIGWNRGFMGLPSYFSGGGESTRSGQMITIHAAGTAVRRVDRPLAPPPASVVGIGL